MTIILEQDIGKMAEITGFDPLVSDESKVLILGSMPGNVSLQQNQYYAHSSNSFWFIMSELFDINPELDYSAKTTSLIKRNIALWDVLRGCKREGSLDSAIQDSSISVNNFRLFLSKHDNIKTIYFNGARAEQIYKKYVLPILPLKFNYLHYHRLPSTSPAYAAMRPDEKLLRWRLVRDYLADFEAKI